jgi:peptidoglycan/LPS O-acetylase OafA/YrhL
VFFVVPFFTNTSYYDFSKQIYHWIYLQDFAMTFNWSYEGPVHFWSLAVEEHFYLFFPFLIYFLKDKYYIVSIYTLIIISIITRYFINIEGYNSFYFTITRMDELVLGALLSVLESRGKLSHKYSSTFVYLFIFSITLTVFFRYIYSTSKLPILHTLKYTIFSLKYFAIIGYVICLKDSAVIGKILTGNFLIYSGKISYGLYVYHPLCFYLLSLLLPIDNLLLKFLVHFGLTYLISSISFYYYESKFLTLKKNFGNKVTN